MIEAKRSTEREWNIAAEHVMHFLPRPVRRNTPPTPLKELQIIDCHEVDIVFTPSSPNMVHGAGQEEGARCVTLRQAGWRGAAP